MTFHKYKVVWPGCTACAIRIGYGMAVNGYKWISFRSGYPLPRLRSFLATAAEAFSAVTHG